MTLYRVNVLCTVTFDDRGVDLIVPIGRVISAVDAEEARHRILAELESQYNARRDMGWQPAGETTTYTVTEVAEAKMA